MASNEAKLRLVHNRTTLKWTVLMNTAKEFARLSTCSRSQVGCVLVKDNRIMATGYNGAPAGMAHCDHSCTCSPDTLRDGTGAFIRRVHEVHCDSYKPCTTAIHAEANAIADAAKRGVSLQGADLFVTMSPCLPCAQLIVSAGIQVVYFKEKYRDASGVKFLVDAGRGVMGCDLDALDGVA